MPTISQVCLAIKKVGFREVGRLPEVLFIDGKYVDKVYMSILEHEFPSDSNNVII